ncbi:EpsG family protein [Pedobacter metabolipauper]|uniref:EpsG-like putative glucosyltransferase n=1 Tax=Pedobacter metabolipauper TaxID=425513 RepID=A0A4R6SVT0_9SPHI|nr:EpsG family protein [Pedobacter metabolipauper]TDQ09910.1 EpsG-like putative glucosyltransferase [Pedobacter metabolipauper]
MIILTFIFLFLTVISILDVVKCPVNLRVLLLIFSGLILVLTAGLRYGDRDYLNYIEIYDLVAKLFVDFDAALVHGEPGYLMLNRIFKTMGIGVTGVFLFMAFCSVGLSLNFFRKYTPYFLIALLIYFSHVFLLRDMVQIRAGLAASISLYALTYVEKRRFWPFIIIILLAASFHGAVLVMILVYVAYPYSIRHPLVIKILVITGFLAGLILKASLLEYLITNVFNVPALVLYLAEPEYFASLGLLNIVLLKNVILILFLIYYKDVIAEHVPHFQVYLLSLAIGIFWLSTFNNFAILAARVATYLSNVEHILLPALFFTKINKFLLWGIVVLYCIVMFASKFSTFADLSYIFLK